MAQHDARDGRYTIDIRVFLALVMATMSVSFLAGVLMIPPDATVVRSTTVEYAEFNTSSGSGNTASDDEVHRPAGQHLLVDIRNVDGDFLNSEKRLSEAMVETVLQAGLTMLSYHCHVLSPAGISCVGVLLESHISFHTWPDEGVITLDLFTCGENPLLPVVATIERLFGIGDDAKAQWSHELRGFRTDEENKSNYLADSSDLALWVLSPLEMHSKKQVYSGMTKFQRVDIWDVVEVTDAPTYTDVLKHNMTPGDPRLSDPAYVTPDRMLFLDGTLQSIRSAEGIYHEALVHPAMFAHPGPRNVAILGGGEGATLREVLKHTTLESATMIEIDAELVEISRQFLPMFSDCSDLVGRAANCFDDKLATMEYTDGRGWFVDRFAENPTVEAKPEAFDVVIIDALDPEDDSFISDILYNDENFVASLMNSLTDDGVLVVQVGTAATIDEPRPEYGIYKNREILFNNFENNPSVEAMLVYEDPHCGFLEPHSFLIVCKSASCRSRWYGRSDQVDYQIYDRITRTHSKKRALNYFDGTTQRTYQWPKKGWETVYCRRDPVPFECAFRTLDPKAEIHDFILDGEEGESSFRVETKGTGDKKVTKVFATKDIPEGSLIMPEHLASSLMLTSRNLEGLQSNAHAGGSRVAVISDLLEFFDDFAHDSTMAGSDQHYVEIGGSVLIRRTKDDASVNVKKWMPEHPNGQRPKYSPVYERNRVSFDVFLVASKHIAIGEEVVLHEATW